jgi:hypothetical protein
VTPQTCYALIADPEITNGHTLPGNTAEGALIYTRSAPRQLELEEFAETHDLTPTAIVTDHDTLPIAVAALTPIGEVQTNDCGDYWCAEGWTVTDRLPITAAFGPQADQIIDLVRLAERVLAAAPDDSVVNEYTLAVEGLYAQVAVDQLQMAACEALRDVDAEPEFWFQVGTRTYGDEVLALAARDLIGATPRWTQQAYDALTRPWRVALRRPAHPDDTAPTAT